MLIIGTYSTYDPGTSVASNFTVNGALTVTGNASFAGSVSVASGITTETLNVVTSAAISRLSTTLTLPNGTVSNPGLNWIGATTTGFYQQGGNMRVSVAGVLAGVFVSTGFQLPSGGGVSTNSATNSVFLTGDTGSGAGGEIRAYGSSHSNFNSVEVWSGGTLYGSFKSAGATFLRDLTVGGSLTVVGGMTLMGNAFFGGSLSVLGGISLVGTANLNRAVITNGLSLLSTLNVGGGATIVGNLNSPGVADLRMAVRNITNTDSPYTVLATDRAVNISAASGNVSVVLASAASCTGVIQYFKRTDSSTNTVQFSGTIDDLTNPFLFKEETVQIVSNGSNWRAVTPKSYRVSTLSLSRVTGSTPSSSGQYRSRLRAANSNTFSDTNGSPGTAPTAADGFVIYRNTAWNTVNSNNQPTKYEVYVGPNKKIRWEFYTSTGRTGDVDVTPHWSTSTTLSGYCTSFDASTGVATIVAPANSAGTGNPDTGFNNDGAYTSSNVYFDIWVED